MKVISLNVGKTQTIQYKNTTTKTAIFKYPVNEPLQISFLQIAGDQQADPRYHGGETKAVYAYDSTYYQHWQQILPREDWGFGMFGENLTTEGLLDNEVRIGNIYKIGSTILQAMQPRFPCSKLNVRFNLPAMVKLFRQEKRNGIYFKVLEEGAIKTGDVIELMETSPYNITITDVVTCYNTKGKDQQLLSSILAIPYLPKNLKKELETFIVVPTLW